MSLRKLIIPLRFHVLQYMLSNTFVLTLDGNEQHCSLLIAERDFKTGNVTIILTC